MSLLARYSDAPIKRKLTLVGLMVPGLALLLVCVLLTLKDVADWRSRAIADMHTYAAVIGTNAAPAVMFDDRRAAAETLAALASQPDIVHAVIEDNGAKEFATYRKPGHPEHAVPRLAPGDSRFGPDSLAIAQTIRVKGESLGTIYLASDLTRMYAGITRSAGLILLVTVGAFLLAAALFGRFQRAIVGPIEDLSTVMRNVSAQQDYAVRVTVQGRDEVGDLARAFNHMLERIQQRDGELARYREHLEAEVAQRTFDLRDVNRRLEQVNESLREREREARGHVEELTRANGELQALNAKLEQAQNQLLQTEKMASIGMLAAGVAHEINNPVGFIKSNMQTLGNYVEDMLRVVSAYEQVEAGLPEQRALFEELHRLEEEIGFAYEKQDVQALLSESRQGLERVTKIVQDLKDFSRTETQDKWVLDDIHKGIESTLNVIWNELKYKCEVKKEYGQLPPVECLLSQLNQVFMNLLVNAAQAIETKGTITIRTGVEGGMVWIEIADTGKGIAPENLKHVFDPFFTTKPVGKGTGLGLSVSYSIVQKHHGRIDVASEVGRGTTFCVWLPIRQLSPNDVAVAV